MALRPEYSLGQSQFNDFLFAVVGEEKSGAQLTVLSALARLGFDPWAEAARLSEMTGEVAANALAATIAALPEGNWKASDSLSIAVRLVGRLPEHVSPPAESPRGGSIRGRMTKWETAQKWLPPIAVGLAVLVFLWRLYGD